MRWAYGFAQASLRLFSPRCSRAASCWSSRRSSRHPPPGRSPPSRRTPAVPRSRRTAPAVTARISWAYPPLAGAAFIGGWSTRNTRDLFGLIQTTMPTDRPGALSGRHLREHRRVHPAIERTHAGHAAADCGDIGADRRRRDRARCRRQRPRRPRRPRKPRRLRPQGEARERRLARPAADAVNHRPRWSGSRSRAK